MPTQALFLMNNEFVHEQSRALAERAIGAAPDDAGRAAFAWRTTLGRAPSDEETAEALAFLERLRSAPSEKAMPATEGELAAWSALGRTLLTRNEFLFVD